MWMEEEIGYKVFVQRATWEQAEQICQEHYAHLSSVMSEEENNVIYEIAKASIEKSDSELLWLGGRQKNYPSSKEWSWADGKAFSYTNWDSDEPNDVDNNEQCLEVLIICSTLQ
ncbi:lectin C-type domain protein [Cooperia oncophora]